MVTGGIAQWVVRLERWGDDGHAVHISAGSEDDVQHLDIISRQFETLFVFRLTEE